MKNTGVAQDSQFIEAYRPSELNAVTVEYRENRRVIKCFCGQEVSRSIVPHLKKQHPTQWYDWTKAFIKLRGTGYPLKRIMRLFRAGDGKLLFSWTVIERAIRQEVERGNLVYSPPPTKKVEHWNPDEFILETNTVWDFPRRGDWAVHSGDYRGNWPPQIPRNLMERYTSRGDLVVDPFVGGGTTLIEAWLLGRHSVGLDISKLAIQTTSAKLEEMGNLAKKSSPFALDNSYRPKVIKGNALDLTSILRIHGLGSSKAKLVCVHPPYLDSLKYTVNNSNDLALISDPEVFCQRMRRFARQALATLSTDGVCAVLTGDVRKQGKIIPLGFKVLQSFLEEGFDLDSIAIKLQHRDRSSEFYINHSNRSLLFAHEYLFILLKKQV